MKTSIPNAQNELLDVLVEGGGRVAVIMAHGFGTSKHETGSFFDFISGELVKSNYKVIRFDFSGYGDSEGKSEDVDVKKSSQDLESIIKWTKENYPGDIYLISQSMATIFTSFLMPKGIKKTIFTAHVNPTTKPVIDSIQNRIKNKPGGVVNEEGVSLYPRSSGQVQKIGKNFFKSLKNFKPLKEFKSFGKYTDLLLIHGNQDEIVGNQDFDKFKDHPEFKYIEIDGDHSFSSQESRGQLIIEILNHFN